MVKRWLTPQYDRPGSSLRIFLKIQQHVYGQKMIDPLQNNRAESNDIQPGSHLRIFLKIQHVYGQKMIDPPSMTNQDLHLEFFLKIQHAHGQKMIDPPVIFLMTDQDLT